MRSSTEPDVPNKIYDLNSSTSTYFSLIVSSKIKLHFPEDTIALDKTCFLMHIINNGIIEHQIRTQGNADAAYSAKIDNGGGNENAES
jgi:hypothetical protein